MLFVTISVNAKVDLLAYYVACSVSGYCLPYRVIDGVELEKNVAIDKCQIDPTWMMTACSGIIIPGDKSFAGHCFLFRAVILAGQRAWSSNGDVCRLDVRQCGKTRRKRQLW